MTLVPFQVDGYEGHLEGEFQTSMTLGLDANSNPTVRFAVTVPGGARFIPADRTKPSFLLSATSYVHAGWEATTSGAGTVLSAPVVSQSDLTADQGTVIDAIRASWNRDQSGQIRDVAGLIAALMKVEDDRSIGPDTKARFFAEFNLDGMIRRGEVHWEGETQRMGLANLLGVQRVNGSEVSPRIEAGIGSSLIRRATTRLLTGPPAGAFDEIDASGSGGSRTPLFWSESARAVLTGLDRNQIQMLSGRMQTVGRGPGINSGLAVTAINSVINDLLTGQAPAAEGLVL